MPIVCCFSVPYLISGICRNATTTFVHLMWLAILLIQWSGLRWECLSPEPIASSDNAERMCAKGCVSLSRDRSREAWRVAFGHYSTGIVPQIHHWAGEFSFWLPFWSTSFELILFCYAPFLETPSSALFVRSIIWCCPWDEWPRGIHVPRGHQYRNDIWTSSGPCAWCGRIFDWNDERESEELSRIWTLVLQDDGLSCFRWQGKSYLCWWLN